LFGITFCILAFASTFLVKHYAGLGNGLGMTMAWGYSYGLLRANFHDGYSHLIFDAAAMAVYTVLFQPAQINGGAATKQWLIALVAWPAVLLFLPADDSFMIQLVGFRAAAIFLPFLLVAIWVTREEWGTFARWLAILNLLAVAVAVLEYVFGVEMFQPRHAATDLIYTSGVGDDLYRIPSSFIHAHAFGGTMMMSLPFLISNYLESTTSARVRILMTASVLAAVAGILLSATRSSVAIGVMGFLFAFLSNGPRLLSPRATALVVFGGILCYFATSEIDLRLQRFRSLGDTDMVLQRAGATDPFIHFERIGSTAYNYPLGNGLTGAFGISIPFMLRDQVNPHQTIVGAENEYARIAASQGIPGLLLFVAFFAWLLTRRYHNDYLSRLAYGFVVAAIIAALTGSGMLAGAPNGPLLILLMGWLMRETEDARQHDLQFRSL
jgi:hypothetical protein